MANTPIVWRNSSFVKIAEEYFPAGPIFDSAQPFEFEVARFEARSEERPGAAPLWDRLRFLRLPALSRFAIYARSFLRGCFRSLANQRNRRGLP